MFWVLLLAGAAVFAAGALAVPVHVALSARRDVDLETYVGVSWLFFKVSHRIGEGRRKPKTRREKKGRRRSVTDWKSLARALSTRGLWKSMARLFRRLRGAVRVRRLTAELSVGLEDPADTGRVFGAVAPLALLINRIPRCGVLITPDFERMGLHGQGEAALTLSPVRALSGLLLFLGSPAMWRLAWLMIRARWTR